MEIVIGLAALLAGLSLWVFLVTARASGHRLPSVWSRGGYPWSLWLTYLWLGLAIFGGVLVTRGLWGYVAVVLAYGLASAVVVAVHNARLATNER